MSLKTAFAWSKPETWSQCSWVATRTSRWCFVGSAMSFATAVISSSLPGVPRMTPQSMRMKNRPLLLGNDSRKQSPSPCRYIRTVTEGTARFGFGAGGGVGAEVSSGFFRAMIDLCLLAFPDPHFPPGRTRFPSSPSASHSTLSHRSTPAHQPRLERAGQVLVPGQHADRVAVLPAGAARDLARKMPHAALQGRAVGGHANRHRLRDLA